VTAGVDFTMTVSSNGMYSICVRILGVSRFSSLVNCMGGIRFALLAFAEPDQAASLLTI
jgi:hypothetical protein